ncbi:hypothetical protein [Gordonia neofelifaecis]|uniref:Uncharacterized protein n=1 Tax=Gordonia neofelifaecis NRRL B-59395 TaxID=644548 RepID=F1YJE7_9ACTN|nr:hypothetical protein [Gordonia neofelifaecis]EGD55180.1 hypothetical protein SCNU_09919 [Gordonia neofelifaecis NRRL B-59395]
MTAAELVPVRSTGVTSTHHVRGVGHHDHEEYVTDDGTRVIVSEYRRRTDPLTVTWWDDDGRRQEVRARGSARLVLASAGFTLID